MNDLRYSARAFLRAPGLALALLMTIALGVGSNAAVYGFANGLMARNVPLGLQQDVVSLFSRDAQRSAALSYDEYLALKGHTGVFDWIGVVRETHRTLVRDGQSTIVAVASVTPELTTLLNLPLGSGSVISYRLWQTAFKGKADGNGTKIRIDDVSDRVAAIAPEWLDGLYAGTAIDVWTPLREEALEDVDRTSRSFWVLARLHPNVTIEKARAALNAGRNGPSEIGVSRYSGMTPEMAEGLARITSLLGLGSAAVLFIACANVASFLLGRASARAHETSVCVALGATRERLMRQLLSDSVLISATGAAGGVLLAFWTSDVIPALFFEEDAERLTFAPDVSWILLTAALCAVVMTACGLLPLLEVRHDRPATVLQRESSGPSRRTRRLRAALVITQMTCCCVLVISTTFLLHGFRWSLRTGVGRELGDAVLVTVEASPEKGLRYFEEVEAVAQSLAGVSELTWAGRLPGGRPVWQSLRIDPARSPLRDVTILAAVFTRDSLRLVTLPPASGRMFGIRDTARSCRVAVVNEQAAQQLFGGVSAGRTVLDSGDQRIEVIGVVAARKDDGSRVVPTLYYYPDQKGEPYDWVGPSRFRAPAGPLRNAVLDANVVSPNYFDRMGFRMIRKSALAVPCRGAVINQQAADRYFGDDPIGSAVIDTAGRRTEIVGVVQSPPLHTFQRAAEPAIFYPMHEDFTPRMTLILRTGRVDEAWLTALRRRLEGVPGARAAPIVKTLETYLRQTALAPLRVATVLVAAFATIALALGVLGLYSALSDAARQRRREVALRIALGAQGWRIIRQVVEEGVRLAATGMAAGLLVSVVAIQLLRGLAPSGVPLNVWVWLAAPFVLLGVVAVASVLPAFRALAVDPLMITRADN